jgi:hypothetical protein
MAFRVGIARAARGWNRWHPCLLLVLAATCGVGCGTAGDARPPWQLPQNDGGADGGGSPSIAFRKITLHRDFTCEGATFGDIDGDGVMDVVAGPEWYRGPDFTEIHAIWPRMAFDPKGYSDCFFEFTRDFDADGWLDVLVVGFPGQGAFWYQNPGPSDGPWNQHLVAPVVDGESPSFTDLTGDGVAELVFMRDARLGFADPDPADPTAPWRFHPISEPRGFGAFTHGLGVGDLDGDLRPDVLEATGYFRQPTSLVGDPPWNRRDQAFGPGGAEMFVNDFDGDGVADVITTLAAHGYGLSWFQQPPLDAGGTFVEHVIVPNEPPAPDAAVILHEPHALALVDIDGDGLLDAVTGERFWGHVPGGHPDFGAPARLHWFRHGRGPDGRSPTWTPALIDDDSGVGTQITVGDVNADTMPDIVVSNKKGAFVFLQIRN